MSTADSRGERPEVASEVAWLRERLAERDAVVRQLRRRLLLLATKLPPELLEYLDGDLDELEARPEASYSPLSGWLETTVPEPADLVAELRLVWARLAS